MLTPVNACLIALLAATPEPTDTAGETWRTANRCGINATYIALRLNDIDVDYDKVLERLPVDEQGTTLREMRDCLVSFGLDARVVRAGPEALQRCVLPVIAHLEEQKDASGHYQVIIQTRPDGVLSIDGTSAATNWVDMQKFRERWTGYLLVIERRPWWRPLLPVAGVLGLTSLLLGLYGPYRAGWGRRGRAGQPVTTTPSQGDPS